MIMMDQRPVRDLRYNWTVNVVDGGFFGLGLGLASFVTVVPLFISSMTDSAILIGLIPAIQKVGWQLPQLFTADAVSRLKWYKPTVLWMTIHERIPFFGLALIALFLPQIGSQAALALTFAMLIWQGLGGGLTATAWQSMLAKIIPANLRGTFIGTQESASNLFASGGVIAAGLILQSVNGASGFALSFILAGIAMVVSWIFLALTREPEHAALPETATRHTAWRNLAAIVQRDANFRWFLVGRTLSQLAVSVLPFYIVFAVRRHGMDEAMAGVMTGTLLVTQILANPLLGGLSDRLSRRRVMQVGALAATASALLAALAPSLNWFFAVFILTGIANVAFWTVAMAMTLEFGTDAERPAYVALTNTLIAPSAIVGPIMGGWLADAFGYPVAFGAAAAAAFATGIVFQLTVRDPKRIPATNLTSQ